MLQSQRTGLVMAPRRGPCPRTHLPAGDRRPHSPGGGGSWRGVGQAEGPLECVWMRREKGSPGSPSEMSLSLLGPGAKLSHGGHAPSPRGSNQS